jgi:iron complex outermembrane recepter protein
MGKSGYAGDNTRSGGKSGWAQLTLSTACATLMASTWAAGQASAAEPATAPSLQGATQASDDGAATPILEEIVVSAQKREQNLQTVGISVAAFSAKQLEALNISSSTEIAQVTPGVHIGGAAAGQFVTFTIRGVTQNDFADHTESPTAVYIDDAYIASMQGQSFALYDLERIEVIKGPQGTLFGRNATGGLVHFITQQPSFTSDGYVDVTAGSYDQRKLEAAGGGALSDTVAIRVAGLYSEYDSWLDNTYIRDNQQRADSEGSDSTRAGRVQLLLKPNDQLNVGLVVHGGKSQKSTAPYDQRPTIAVLDAQGRVIDSLVAAPAETRFAVIPTGAVNVDPSLVGTRPVPGADWYGYPGGDAQSLTVSKNYARQDANTTEMYGAGAHINYAFDSFDFTSNTDYVNVSKDISMDIDASPRSELVFPAIARTWNASQEFRLSGASDSLRWVAGAYLLRIDTTAETGFVIAPPLDASPTQVRFSAPYARDSNDLETNSYSLFGQLERDLPGNLTLIAGLRGTREEKDFSYVSDFLINGTLIANTRDYARSTRDTLWSGKLQLDWKPDDDLLLYAGVNRGVKAGSFNAPLAGNPAITDAQLAYEPEALYAYEVGMKSELFDHRARVNTAVYYYDYRNYQASLFLGLAQRILNAKASVRGAEVSVVTSPIQGLDLQLGAAYVDTNVDNVDVNGVVRDRHAAFAPEWSGSGSVRYSWPIATVSAFAQVDATYSSSFYYSLNNFTSSQIDDYVLTNAQVGVQSQDERWTVTAFVKNLADERYDVVGFDLSTAGGYSERAYGAPRWYGASVRYNFR